MFPFSLYLPTRIYAGRDCVEQLPDAVKKYGQNVLIAYGGGSVARSGLLDRVKNLLCGFNLIEFSGITPNPKLAAVRAGVKICRENKIDFIVSLGGSSALDCCKHIAAAVAYEGEPWDLVTDSAKIGECLPIFAVMTMAATGSEYDGYGVITREDTHEKLEIMSENLFPAAAFLDPCYTFSVPAFQTASGAADIISHVFEQYFVAKGNILTDGFCEAMLRTVVNCTPAAIREPDNYDARYQLMMASIFGCCGLLSMARTPSPWPCHAIEHEVSAWYDVTHGAGLAVIIPRWMRYSLNRDTARRFARYGYNVFSIEKTEDPYADAMKAIDATAEFFRQIGLPDRLSDLNSAITDEHFKEMALHIEKSWSDLKNSFVPIDEDGILTILKESL